MPELPDLQVYSKNLKKIFADKKLVKVAIYNTKKLNAPKEEFSTLLEGKVLCDVIRQGKELHLYFADTVLGLHLMLKGQLQLYSEGNNSKNKIIELVFEGNTGIILSDFMGQALAILNPEKVHVPDALSEDLTIDYLVRILKNESSKSIKSVLLDQKLIRGIGNAYADEILYDCSISPFSIAGNIPNEKTEDLLASIKRVLSTAIIEIEKRQPDIISGEIREFFKVHTPKKEFTERNDKIHFQEMNSKKTYFTDTQIKY